MVQTHETDLKSRLLDALIVHVPFEGWSDAALTAAVADCAVTFEDARAVFPRGPVDMALAYHQRGDVMMLDRMQAADLGTLKYSERIKAGVRFRLEVADRELVRKGTALFSLPQYAAIGTGAVWQTCGHIWEALGDTSRDVNWYTKRATLAAVYSSTLLYWLGDDSEDHAATWAFLDRRIDNVMRFETFKRSAKDTMLGKALMRGPGRIFDHIKAPVRGE